MSKSRSKAAPSGPPPGFKDIWTLAFEHKQQAGANANLETEDEKPSGSGIAHDVYHSHTVFVGAHSAGKSTLLGRLLGKDDKVKPTPVLEYAYGRRKDRYTDAVKAVAHLWELGGGTQLADLVRFPLNAEAISTSTVVICLDLSKPNNCLAVLKFWLDKLSQLVKGVYAESPSAKPSELDAAAWVDHSDRGSTEDIGVPLVIVGTKFDEFDKTEAGERKIFCRALRYLAHKHRASIIFVSTQSESQTMHFRKLMNRYAFSAPSFSKAPNVNDHMKALLIASGQDSYLAIGEAPTVQGSSASTDEEKWIAACENYFGAPDAGANTSAKDDDPDWEKSFPTEAEVDSMRALKDEELEKYRVESRKKKEVAT